MIIENSGIIERTASEVLELKLPASTDLVKKAQEIRAAADILLILDDDSLIAAKGDMDRMKKESKDFDDFRKSITRPLDEKKKEVMALFAPVVGAYKDTMAAYKTGVAEYLAAQERDREVEQAKAAAETLAERKVLEERAKAAETEEERQAIQEAAALVQATPVAPAPKVKGIVTYKKWKSVVTDKAAFIRAAIEREGLLDTIEVDLGKLNRLINAMGGTIEIPGIEKRQEIVVVNR